MTDDILKQITETTIPNGLIYTVIDGDQYPLAIDNNGSLLQWRHSFIEVHGKSIEFKELDIVPKFYYEY